jgi:hypothetical protein
LKYNGVGVLQEGEYHMMIIVAGKENLVYVL